MDRLTAIRRRARRLRDVTRAQELEIVAASAEGKSLREIAEAAGMSPEGVRQMLRRTVITGSRPGRSAQPKGGTAP